MIRNIDIIIIREPSLLQSYTERQAVRKLTKEAMEEFQKIPKSERVKHAYLITDSCKNMITTELPSFWNQNILRQSQSHFVW